MTLALEHGCQTHLTITWASSTYSEVACLTPHYVQLSFLLVLVNVNSINGTFYTILFNTFMLRNHAIGSSFAVYLFPCRTFLSTLLSLRFLFQSLCHCYQLAWFFITMCNDTPEVAHCCTRELWKPWRNCWINLSARFSQGFFLEMTLLLQFSVFCWAYWQVVQSRGRCMLRGHYTTYGLSMCLYISMASFLPSNHAVVFNCLTCAA